MNSQTAIYTIASNVVRCTCKVGCKKLVYLQRTRLNAALNNRFIKSLCGIVGRCCNSFQIWKRVTKHQCNASWFFMKMCLDFNKRYCPGNLNLWWRIVNEVFWYLHESNFTRGAHHIHPLHMLAIPNHARPTLLRSPLVAQTRSQIQLR